MTLPSPLHTFTGPQCPLVHSTLKLGIALLKEGNRRVQDVCCHDNQSVLSVKYDLEISRQLKSMTIYMLQLVSISLLFSTQYAHHPPPSGHASRVTRNGRWISIQHCYTDGLLQVGGACNSTPHHRYSHTNHSSHMYAHTSSQITHHTCMPTHPHKSLIIHVCPHILTNHSSYMYAHTFSQITHHTHTPTQPHKSLITHIHPRNLTNHSSHAHTHTSSQITHHTHMPAYTVYLTGMLLRDSISLSHLKLLLLKMMVSYNHNVFLSCFSRTPFIDIVLYIGILLLLHHFSLCVGLIYN